MPGTISPGCGRRASGTWLALVERPVVSVATVSVNQRLPFAPKDLHALVSDVRSYPRFIPWVKSLSLRLEREEGSAWTGVASALVGWKAFLERFETRVVSAPAAGTIDVSLVSGPFRVLENTWRFAEDGAGGAQVAFSIRYQFKNPLLQAVAGANRARAAERIMAAFAAEAQRRFGAAKPSNPG
jgi:coenzyme Q-binding protein COQ10